MAKEVSRWLDSINRAISSGSARTTPNIEMTLTLENEKQFKQALHTAFGADGIGGLVEDFMTLEVAPRMQEEFNARSQNQEYQVRYVSASGEPEFFRNQTELLSGMEELKGKLMRRARTDFGQRVGMGIGPIDTLMKMELNQYMPVNFGPADSESPNSLFFAVEFGTGLGENVGSSKWIRREDPLGVKHKGSGSSPSASWGSPDDGSWWLGPHEGSGIRVLGQKGFHFLYDARTRRPHKSWINLFLKRFPVFFKHHFEKRFLGK